MNRYLQALDIITFIPKKLPDQANALPIAADIPNTHDINQLDVLIIALQPADTALVALFHKIVSSITLIDATIRYHSVLLTQDSNAELAELSKQYNFTQLIKLGNINVAQISKSYNLKSNNILQAQSLANLHSDANLKKQLWLDFKNFLAK